MNNHSFLIVIFCLSLATLGYGQEKSVVKHSTDWQYTVAKPGLRMVSEDVPQWHQLHYKGKELPDFLFKEGLKVTNDIGTFRYSQREDQHSSGGWVHISDKKTVDAKVADIFTSGEEFKQGYYFATFDEKHPFTPDHWIYVEADDQKEDLYWTDKQIHYWIDLDTCCKRPDTDNKVLKVANEYAVKEGYNLNEYEEPEVKFDFLTQEWILFYN